MSTHAPEQIDPLARLGRQIVVAAERRAARRHRQRTLALLCMATLALVAIAGVGAIESDIVGPVPPQGFHDFAPDGDGRVDLEVREGLDTPWRLTMYRSVKDGLCTAAPTSTAKSPQVFCRAATIVAEELEAEPLELNAGVILQSDAADDTVLVFGLARPEAEHLELLSPSGDTVARALDGTTIEARTIDFKTNEPTGTLTVRPFAVLFTVPTGTKEISLRVHEDNGQITPLDLPVVPIEKTR